VEWNPTIQLPVGFAGMPSAAIASDANREDGIEQSC
jgi:hypothetical protein